MTRIELWDNFFFFLIVGQWVRRGLVKSKIAETKGIQLSTNANRHSCQSRLWLGP